MRRTILVISVMLMSAAYAFAQNRVAPNKPNQVLSTEPGYVTINELNGGPGLGIVSAPYAKYFFGFTTIHGYQVDQSFMVAGGTGFSAYNGGSMIPLFIDLRYCFPMGEFAPYGSGDGGVLFMFKGGTKLFINPAAGVRYTLSRNVALNFSTGLFIQTGEGVRDSYVNFKLGVTYVLR
jgi:hypothetical protein